MNGEMSISGEKPRNVDVVVVSVLHMVILVRRFSFFSAINKMVITMLFPEA